MERTEVLFFELLRVAVGNQNCLSHTPTEKEWHALYETASKQALIGVCFKALERLHRQGQVPSQNLLLEWIGVAESIRARNELLNIQCKTLQEKLTDAGIRSSILKGQAVARYYVNADSTDEARNLTPYRQSGDIDIYVDCGLYGALDFAHKQGQRDVKWDYKHLHLDIFTDTKVEMHYHVGTLMNMLKNYRLQRWFKGHEGMLFSEQGDFVAPTTAFNKFYILLHIYRHFLYEGIGMRQLMDYYYVLRHADHTDATEIQDTLRKFGMLRFAHGVMWVLQEVFALERQHMVCEPLEKEGEFILKEVMTGGNFGHYDERTNHNRHGKIGTVMAVCKHNCHLLRHYPTEVFWPPVWFVWHKCWKLKMKRRLKDKANV